uniref:beta strand repeat-containing protein n=1 Tax=Algoriphagus sp. TaxID=1872435 RepID=UPI004048063A
MINPQGGTAPYTYSWETRATAADPWQTLVLNGSTINPNSRRIVGAPQADYRVTVTDQSTPALQGSGIYTLSPPISLTATTHFEGLICSSEPNSGLALLEFDNGFPDYIWELVQGTTIIQQGTTDEFAIAIENLAVGTYTFNWTDDNDCTGTKTVTIAEPPSPLTATFTSQNVTCPAGTDGSITVSSISGGWGATYLIRIFRNGVQYRPWGPDQTNYTNLPAGTYTIEYTDKVNPANGYPFNLFTFSINQFTGCYKSASITITEPAPFSVPVTQSPAVCQGETDGFLSLVPIGGSPPYQVTFYSGHFDNVLIPVVDPNDMATVGQETGVTSGQTVTQNGLAAGQYAIQLIDFNGCIYSGNFTLIENPKPIVADQTVPTVCSDSPLGVNFNSSTSVAAATYNVTALNLNGLTVSAGGAAVANGLTATDLADDAFTNTTTAPVNVIYTVVPVSAAGCQGNPFTITVTIDPEPVVANQTQTVCSDVPLTGFTLGNDLDGPNVASYNITGINLNGLAVSAGTPTTGTGFLANALADDAFTNTTNADVDVIYTIVPVGVNGCLGDPFTVTATIKPEPVVANQVKPVCSDEPLGISFNPSTSVPAATYNITAINQNGLVASAGNPTTGTGLAANVIADDAFTNNTSAAVDVVYDVVPVSADGCLGNPFTLTVTVNPEPVVANQSLTVVGNGTVGLILGDDTNGPNVSTYNITSILSNGLIPGSGNIGIQNGVSQNAIASDTWSNPTNSTNTVVYTVVPVTSLGCQGEAFTVTLTITEQPVVSNQIVSACSDVPLTGFTLGNDLDGPSVVSYNITGINLNGLAVSAGTPTTGTGLSANVLADDAFTNTTNADVDVIYTIVPVGNNGSFGDPFTVTATIKPEPVVANQVKPVCSDEPLGISFNPSTSVPAATYNITAINQNGLVASAGNPTTGTGLAANVIADDAFTNNTSAAVDVVYDVVPVSADGCLGNPFTLTVTVNPEPVVANQTVPTVCSDSPLGVNFNSSTSVAAATYNVTALNLNGLTVSAGGAAVANGLTATDLADDAFTNTTTAPVNVIYTVVPVSAAGCQGNPFTITVTIDPEPVVANQTQTVCSDVPLTGFTLGNDLDGPNVASYNITGINLNGLAVSAGTPTTGTGF